ncbi:hypothetical protein CsatB_008129 [Cannabis sativa]|uniref:uncharacterized protein LOC115725251 n=1 Tax=Cannabis sativa TaxID=3483 RepID=UPI0011DF384D|nr:uncharacterized protein LOC115725251 [Cannabis sativa]
MNEELMDHTPAVMTFHNMVPSGKKPFRYFRMWNTHSDYAARVVASWNQQTQGLKMFQVVTKLKRLKGVLKELNKQAFSDIQMSTQQAKDTLAEMQNKLHQDPLNQMLQQEELAARKDYTALLKNYQTYLQQKAKVTWLKNGDKNTALFHASIKARRRQNRVFSIQNQDGERLEEEAKISEAFLSYYKGLLGTKMQGRRTVITSLAQSGAVLSDQLASWLCQDYSCGEIKVVVFAILGIKAPGPDGYSSYFFQDNWELIQGDSPTLVTRSEVSLNDFRVTQYMSLKPVFVVVIACCNVIYEIATKLICLRLKHVLPELVAQNQGVKYREDL